MNVPAMLKIKCTTRWLAFSAMFILSISSKTAIAQLSRIDNLKNNIRQTDGKAEKLTAIFALCEAYESLNPDTLYTYTLQAKQLALELKNSEKVMVAEYYEAVYLFKKNKLDSALSATNTLIVKYKKAVPYNDIVVSLYVLKFNEFWRKNNFNEAIATSQELLKQAEEHNDTTGLIKGKIDMGAAYHIVSNQPKEGLKWYYQALALLSNEGYKRKFSSVYQNIAIAYDDLKIKDSVIAYLKPGLYYARLGDNKTNLARALRLYGSIMADYKYFKEAEPAFREAIEVQKSIGDIFGTIRAMQGEADFYSSTGNNSKAIEIYKDALTFAEASGTTLVMTYDLHQNLAQSYAAIGDYKNSNGVLNRMLAIKDSNYKINSAQALAEMQTKYDVQKKETLIARQKLDLLQRKLLLYGAGVLAAVLIVFSVYRFKKYQQRQKTKLAALMEEEKRQSELAVKDAEEKERKRIAAELHDNLGVQANAILHNSTLLSDGKAGDKNIVADLQETAKEMLLNLRETLWAMKATDVTAVDMWLRIINFMKQMGRHYTAMNFIIEGEAPKDFIIPSQKALNMVLVLQEAVNNAVKHADAASITAKSTKAGNEWTISITDDGDGFDTAAAIKMDSYGLQNMAERAAAGGFIYNIKAVEERGTVITISISA
jgi:two-component system, NarL family, sensor kinase